MRSVLVKTCGRTFLVFALFWPCGSLRAAPDSASLTEFFQPPEFLRGVISSQAVDGPLAAHTSGSFGATVSGAGHVGRWFTVGTDPLLPSFEYPRGSRVEYLRAGTLWFGGIVGGDTSTTVGKDGWLWWSVGELWPEEPDSALRLVSGPADQNYEAIYTDTSVFDLTWDPIDGYHRPLNLRVTQRSYSWRDAPFDDFLIIEYHIENIGLEVIHDAWAGLYFDADVGFAGSEIGTLPSGQTDDLAGFLPDDGIAYIIDNDGHNSVLSEGWDSTSQRAAIGVKILDMQPEPLYSTPNFNWWLRGGDSLTDWGPRLAGTPDDPFRDFGRFTGVPVGDANKYYMLSHREQDYDQVFSALDYSADGWLPPVFSAGPSHALGGDTRFTISNGGVDIAPGDTLLLVVAIGIGADVHTGPDDFRNYFDPYWPDFIYDSWDFRDLQRNMSAAESLYFSGYNTPVYSPPPAPRVTETGAGARVSWIYSGNQYVNGYDVYFRKIPDNLVFCDAFPVDTPSLSAAQIINGAPVTTDEYFLDNLVDGAWYQVAVAVTPEGGREPEISEVTLFKTGRPNAPQLRKIFASEAQRSGNFVVQEDELVLRWEDDNPDAAGFNVYRFDADSVAALSPVRIERWNSPCPGDNLQCDSLIAFTGQHLCAYRTQPYQTLSGSAREYREPYSGPSKYHYLVTTIDNAGAESAPSEPLTVYVRPSERKPLALFVADTSGALWLTQWDSVTAFYRRTLARYTPDIFTYTTGGVRKPAPRFADVGMYDVVLFDGAGLSSPVSGNEFVSRQSWLEDIARTGGVMVYLGSGFSFGHSPALPGLYTRVFGETRTAYEVFGIDSTALISRGSHMSVNSGDSLFHYFQPAGAEPALGSVFPALNYDVSGFYASDDFNSGPSPFKGVIYPRPDNTEVLYTYRSGRDPVSALDGEAIAIRYSPPSHTAYTFLLAPWEWGEYEVEAFFTELMGDFQTAAPDDPSPVLPTEFVLGQNHPNPFNPETTIDFALPRRATVELSVYNILGQRVTTLYSGEAAAGRHTVKWRADSYASGVYFYRLSAGETTLTRKMLLLK